MSIDRIAHWVADVRPDDTRGEITQALSRYIGYIDRPDLDIEFNIDLNTNHMSLFVPLPGYPSDPFSDRSAAIKTGIYPQKRQFEVVVDGNGIDVITRQQDELTCAIADGFFAACVRRWKMKVEG